MLKRLYADVKTHDDESDEYCPNCDNHFVIDALTPKAALKIESEDTRVDARYENLPFIVQRKLSSSRV